MDDDQGPWRDLYEFDTPVVSRQWRLRSKCDVVADLADLHRSMFVRPMKKIYQTRRAKPKSLCIGLHLKKFTRLWIL
jgi:hypothetical protein